MNATMTDSDTIGQMAVEGIQILHQHLGYAPETADTKRQVSVEFGKCGDPYRRLRSDLGHARDFLDEPVTLGDEGKRLRVSIAHEVLDAVLTAYYPET